MLDARNPTRKYPSETVLRDFYEVNPPFGSVAIKLFSNQTSYETVEPTITEDEEKRILQLKGFLFEELKTPVSSDSQESEIESYLQRNASRLIKQYRLAIPPESLDKVMYYLKRDFLGYSKIDVMMRDPRSRTYRAMALAYLSTYGIGITKAYPAMCALIQRRNSPPSL